MSKEKEVEHLKYSYDKALDIFKLHNENYFKRTQIIMVAIQAGLFFALLKLINKDLHLQKVFVMSIAVTILGIFIAVVWNILMTRQMQYLDLLKKYIKNLEARFKKLGIPVDYFNVEYAISGYTDNDPPPQITTASVDGSNGGRFVKFIWSRAECPEPENGNGSAKTNWFSSAGKWFVRVMFRIVGYGDEGRYMHKIGVARGKMVLIERGLSIAILLFWIIGFSLILCRYYHWL